MCDGYTTEAKLCRRSATPFFRRRISLILMISLQTSVEDGFRLLIPEVKEVKQSLKCSLGPSLFNSFKMV